MAISSNNTIIKVTISKEAKKELERKAQNDGRSISNYVAKLIKEDLDKK